MDDKRRNVILRNERNERKALGAEFIDMGVVKRDATRATANGRVISDEEQSSACTRLVDWKRAEHRRSGSSAWLGDLLVRRARLCRPSNLSAGTHVR
jgi:hypothetical protein